MTVTRFDAPVGEIRALRENSGQGLVFCRHVLRQQNMLKEIEEIRKRFRQNLPVNEQVCDILEMLVRKMLP